MKTPSRLNTACVAALCCTLFLFQAVNVGAASDSGDIDDWSNQRMVYAILSLVIIFVFGVDSEVFMETPEDDYPIITAWVWCMIILGFWATAGIAQ